MKRITKVHNTMQHMLNLLCYSWPAVTGEPNKGKCSREVTSISFGNVPFSCFCQFWISDCMSHVWKCCSYNSDFCASQGQILSPRRKLSRMKKKKRKGKKGKEIRMLYNKKQISACTGQFWECIAESVWLAYLWQGSQICVVCVVLWKIGFQSLNP